MAARDEALLVARSRRAGPPAGARYLLNRYARNRLALWGLWVVAAVVLAAVFAPALAPADPTRTDFGALLQPPSRAHLLGTDDLGRDILSRVIYGARTSLLAGIIAVGLAVAVGVPLGLLSGYFRGRLDNVLMRITDALLSFPLLVLALAIAAVLGAGLTKAMLAVGIVFTPGFIRLARAQVLSEREKVYVEAARALGASDRRIVWRHILPNSLSPVLVQASLAMAAAITAEATLSFLGLGTQPPTPSWGSMLNIAQAYLTRAPWMALWPGLAIFVTVLALNLVGDGLREVLDPRLR
ncbi:MAG: ABC transporter permease [Armatimonadota bacterium]|nr:ABC transporter permease [Armatimonadota bacterium]